MPQWRRDYHLDVQRQYYSVPYQHIGHTVEVLLTTDHVEVLLRDQRIALHLRRPRTPVLPDRCRWL